jgi:hypothetical protein
MICLPHFGD